MQWSRTDLYIIAGFLAFALILTSRLWWGGGSVEVSSNPEDQSFLEWNLLHAAHAITGSESLLFTEQLNGADGGVNLMANTSMLALGIPLAPVTLLFGPSASFALIIVLGLAGTAAGWYYVLSRYCVSSRLAALLGGGVAGFAPGLLSHAGGQPNISALFLLPFLILCVFRMSDPVDSGKRPWLRYGALLGVLTVLQVFINEEILFLTALGCVIAVVTFAVSRWRETRERIARFSAAIGVAVLVAAPLLAYPLWFQFFGPATYEGLPFEPSEHTADLFSFVGVSRESLGGSDGGASALNPAATEDNAFYGWGLFVAALAVAVLQWKRMLVRMAAVSGGVFALFSLGPQISIKGVETPIPGPMALLAELPIFNLVSITRFALLTTVCVAVLMAIGVDRYRKLQQHAPSSMRPLLLWGGVCALIVALLPIAPTTVDTQPRHIPAFIQDDSWRELVGKDRSMLLISPGQARLGTAMQWTVATDLELPIARGYYLAPNRDGTATWSTPERPVTSLLDAVHEAAESQRSSDASAEKKKIPRIEEKHRSQAHADLEHWNVGLVVLDPRHNFHKEVPAAMTKLFGEGETRDGVRIWRVR